ncbi:MAG: hypothetical protein ACLQQ4_16680 [Bacteroidia bacterium]
MSRKKSERKYEALYSQAKFRKSNKRKRKNWRKRIGYLKFLDDANKNARIKGKSRRSTFRGKQYVAPTGPKPAYSETIQYIASKKEAFRNTTKVKGDFSTFTMPKIFSLTENYDESFDILKRLFNVLYYQSASEVFIDYQYCERIDVDASICMDIILGEFIVHFTHCRKVGHKVKVKKIAPINYENESIKKILFSIGSFASIGGLNLSYPDVIPFKLRFSFIKNPKASQQREIDLTKLVDYVETCMRKMNKTLTAEAENSLFKVLGEVLINAEEHSSGDKRFSIGCFLDSNENGEHVGIFNLVILNFGNTIYEKFSSPDCPNKNVVEEMRNLSERYTKKGLFTRAEFQEETLWTLYALQEGVTSKADWNRGNGSIRFIESFFKLKGDNNKDDISYLSIVSGNTRITFDGSYRLIEKVKGHNHRKYKMMTFNHSGDLEEKPDKKFVNFAENYFPGTIISAKICLKESNTELISNEHQ